ncbi:hypothetical protein BDK51DRAFT_42124 [Blyttiomyces helicus]|uniref:WW domain-containing protein n=1 Tax=Blyttiomyces helicus TaxID=388810 RepID=A0A4V1IRT3_9FUNG|nr:hypothetical protein BDK51DRAFT_42124 [Blyttiomyces helicus]|eukprot:RKO91157.1 hypothetical protein BDK51DRAFT_42124 [Blyttiomyces helicus]
MEPRTFENKTIAHTHKLGRKVDASFLHRSSLNKRGLPRCPPAPPEFAPANHQTPPTLTQRSNLETKESVWRLPENYQILDPATGKPYEVEAEPEELSDGGEAEADDGASSGAGDEQPGGEPVDGFPEWRRVDRGDDMAYYFHVSTMEVAWSLPGDGAAAVS